MVFCHDNTKVTKTNAQSLALISSIYYNIVKVDKFASWILSHININEIRTHDIQYRQQ